MPTPEPSASSKREQRTRAGLLKRQARRRTKRREKILAGLTDPLAVTLIEHTFLGESKDDVPLMLVPTRRLRQRVRQLNQRSSQLCAAPSPTPKSDDQPAPFPPDVALDAVVDVVPATRSPRRCNRAAPVLHAPLLPMMPSQKETLAFLLEGMREYPEETGLGRRHRCPICAFSSDPSADHWRSLSVYPTSAGDLVFRCHRCGFCLDSVEFVQRTNSGWTIAQAAQSIVDCGMLTALPSTEQLAGYERLAELHAALGAGRANLPRLVAQGQRAPLFGDWAALSTARLRRLFPDLDPRFRLPADCLVRVSRDVFGRRSALHLHQPRSYAPLYRLELRDWEPPAPLTLFLPRWSDYLEFQQLIFCAQSAVALTMEEAVRRWPDVERLPVALLDRCTGTLDEPNLPFSSVWAVPRGSRSARFALPWCTSITSPGESKVFVRRLPDDVGRAATPPTFCANRTLFCDPVAVPKCMDDLVSIVVAEHGHQPLSLAMSDVLSQPGLRADARRRLVEMVSQRVGVAPAALVPDGLNPWTGGPYALNVAGGVTFIARGGQYWKRGRRDKKFAPVTNFELVLVGDRINARGQLTHDGRLEIGGRKIPVSISTAALENSKRLLNRLSDECRMAGADYPVVSDPKAKRLLSALVKTTQPHPR